MAPPIYFEIVRLTEIVLFYRKIFVLLLIFIVLIFETLLCRNTTTRSRL